MGPLSIAAISVFLALFGWGWMRGMVNWFRHPFNDSARVQQQLQDDGVIKSDGTVKVDPEFDTELNAITKELNDTSSQSGAELDALEKQQ